MINSKNIKLITSLSADEAKKHLLESESYFNLDFPKYLSFQKILSDVSKILKTKDFKEFKTDTWPAKLDKVNYSLIANKDGRFGWRPFELMHPAIYVSLVNNICEKGNWKFIVNRFKDFEKTVVSCCSLPVITNEEENDVAAQVMAWWQQVEQISIVESLQYSHLLHTDVTDCYGSLYTHSIPWALHGIEDSKREIGNKNLFGNVIDRHIQSGRYGQTNGISQGSVLMDLIAELVLGFVDELITEELSSMRDFKIIRYRDDYRIFTNNDEQGQRILKAVSDNLRTVGMRLSMAKTLVATNVVEGSIKADKKAAIDLQDLGDTNAKTLQKKLLRLHSFGLKHPNSGALRKLLAEMHKSIFKLKTKPDDLEVQVAILSDIAFNSPQTFPAIAGILSHLISLEETSKKQSLWESVQLKMSKIPNNGYLEIWLQRVTKPKSVGFDFESDEAICKIVNGGVVQLWNSEWVNNEKLTAALDSKHLVKKDPEKVSAVIKPKEIDLFGKNAFYY